MTFLARGSPTGASGSSRKNQLMKTKLTLLLVALAISSSARANPQIVVGNHVLQPNMAGQVFSIYVTGGDAVQGLNFNVQIGDGGSFTGGSDVGPTIQGVDLLSGIFAGNNSGQTNGVSPLLWNSVVVTDHATVSADGLLANITVSTIGIPPGTFESLSLTPANAYGGPSDFAGTPIDITNGSIGVVPEPESFTLLLVGGAFLAYVVWSRVRNKTIAATYEGEPGKG